MSYSNDIKILKLGWIVILDNVHVPHIYPDLFSFNLTKFVFAGLGPALAKLKSTPTHPLDKI